MNVGFSDAIGDSGFVKQALAAGCDDFLSKPVQFDELIEKIENLFTLQWRYHKSDEPSSIESDQPLVMPTSADLDELRELAQSGDIQGLMDKTLTLTRLDVSLKLSPLNCYFSPKASIYARFEHFWKIRHRMEIANESTHAGRQHYPCCR
jgi:YesN/AraC family two-component response regulator